MQRVLVDELSRGVEREKYRTKGNNDDVAGEGKGRIVVHLWTAMKLRFGVA